MLSSKSADPAGGDHDRLGRQKNGPRWPGRDDAAERIVLDEEAARLAVFEDRDRGGRAGRRDQGAHDLAPRAVAAGMGDAASRMRGFEAEREGAVGRPVEADAEPGEVFDRSRRGAGEEIHDRGVAKPVAGGDRVGRMPGRAVVGPQRRRHPPCASRLEPSAPRGALVSTTTGRGASASAVIRPATPAPTMTTRP